jgi:hypothetical protein
MAGITTAAAAIAGHDKHGMTSTTDPECWASYSICLSVNPLRQKGQTRATKTGYHYCTGGQREPATSRSSALILYPSHGNLIFRILR